MPPNLPQTCPQTTLRTDYRTLEVWDSSRLEELEGVLATETQRLQGVYHIAKEEKRPVIWKNAQFDLKRIEKVRPSPPLPPP